MKFIADFHIHSKFSRATSQQMDLENLAKWAQIKGIQVLGTGDFTHPQWFNELKKKLTPVEPGLYKLKSQDQTSKSHLNSQFPILNSNQETRFILTAEISCIYSKNNQTRKIHLVLLAPDFATVNKINTHLGWIGNLKSDGRPILGLDAKEAAKIVFNINPQCVIVPAHCLLPDTHIHIYPMFKIIKDISVGDRVYTHKGRLKRVERIYKRPYKGKIYHIKPYYFRLGLKTTPEHPFYIIKSNKYCPTLGGEMICKKNCTSKKRERCPHKYFEKYIPQWLQAKEIKRGDILIFPRFNSSIKDIKEIKLNKYLKQKDYKLVNVSIKPSDGTRANFLPNIIKINKDFCRLIGYYLSEGYTDNRDSVSFCFNKKEKDYIKDVKDLMAKIFHFSYCREYQRKDRASLEMIFFSRPLAQIFSKLFYNDSITKRAHTKSLPAWTLNLPLEKQAEILKGWWRGDTGYTSSRTLMNQMKVLCLRLGIIPSIGNDSIDAHHKRGKHRIGTREIIARHDSYWFSNLSFFEDPCSLLEDPCFKKFNTKLKRRHGWVDENYIYIPVREIKIADYEGDVYNLEVKEDNSYLSEFASVHNCWTPWFSLFGSRSGFDTIEECFEEYTKYIFALETGLSSDLAMNWRWSALDRYALISNSDAHSPAKLGREANFFDADLSYQGIVQALKNKTRKEFLSTVEFFPQEGKYHYDGHRLCQVVFSPQETKKHKGICPKCGRALTIGVMSQVEALSDRPLGQKPKGATPFRNLIPLAEVIGEAMNVGPNTKTVWQEYKELITRFNNEFAVLLDASEPQIATATNPEIAEALRRVRQGKVKISPGYDGEYGKIKIFNDGEQKKFSKQKSLI